MHAGDLLTARARLTPSRAALFDVASGQRWTYSELNRRANRCANALTHLGIGKGDRVSILAQNSPAHVDLLYACAKIGAIFVPLSWRLTARELSYIVSDCGPSAIVVGAGYERVFAELNFACETPQPIADLGAGVDAPAYADLLGRAADAEPGRPKLTGDDPLCILYTSGTTGKPKGAVLPHRQIVWNAINTVVSWGLNERDVSPVLTPLFHAGGLFAFLTPILYVGGQVVLGTAQDTDATVRLLEEESCTVILGVPTLFQAWQNAPAFARADFGRVRFFISGGAPCPPSLAQFRRDAKGVAFRQGYGLTEVGVNCFSMTDDDAVQKPGSVGRPIFHSRMRIVDPGSSRDVPAGGVGELLIHGPHVCLGYWLNPAATAQAFVTDDHGAAWFRTGDSARVDDDGFYYIVGRYKDMIKSGGENIYAAEVEEVFRQHAAVADAALIGQPDEKWGEVGLIVVQLRPGCTASAQDLLDFCAGRLARFKIPKRVEFVDALPYSPYGKVIKAELRKAFLP